MGDDDLGGIAPDDVRYFLLWLQGEDTTTDIEPPRGRSSKTLAGSTIDIHFRNLKAFLNWCEFEELLERSPMRKIKRPTFDEILPDPLTESEVKHLLHEVRTNGDRNAYRDFCIHFMFIDTCVRLNELANMKVDHVNLEEGYARVVRGKGRKERIVPVGLKLRRAMHRYLIKYRKANNGVSALFVNEYGFSLGKIGIQRIVIRDLTAYIERDIKQRGPHTLRHTGATFRLRKTRDLKGLSLILGHASTKPTERYTHW